MKMHKKILTALEAYKSDIIKTIPANNKDGYGNLASDKYKAILKDNTYLSYGNAFLPYKNTSYWYLVHFDETGKQIKVIIDTAK